MQLAKLAGGVWALLATAALAASGDALLVTGDRVNVRAGPSTESGVVLRVDRDEPATELARQGQWIEVELPQRNARGWIHASLLALAPAPAVTEVATTDSDALAIFRGEVEYFNNRAVAAAGVDLFTGVEDLGDGGVRVVTTDAWATMPASGQQSYLNALFGRWLAAAGSGQGLHLEIVDPSGTVMMEKSGP